MTKAETEGHDHEVTTEKVDGKQQVVLVKGCARCEEIRKARLKAQKEREEQEAFRAAIQEEKRLTDERQQVFDDLSDLLRTTRPADGRGGEAYDRQVARYRTRLDALDRELNKAAKNGSKTTYNWRKNLTARP